MITILQNYYWCFLLSFGVSLISGWLVANYARVLRLVDKPVSRSSHKAEIPKGGGLGFVVITFFWTFFAKDYWLFLICVLSVFSLLGDRKEIAPQLRFVFQSACAIGVLLWTAPLFFENFFWYAGFFLFIIASMNFFNFMDGIDGLGGLNALVSFLTLAIYAEYHQEQALAIFCLLLVFADIGFLFWNFQIFGKKVFMGDVGSVFLGASIAILVLVLAENWLDFFRLCLLLFFFYADCILTLFAKFLRKIHLSDSHRLHLYQIFANEQSQPHWLVSVAYAIAQALIVILVFLYANSWQKLLIFYWILMPTFFFFYIFSRKKIIDKFF